MKRISLFIFALCIVSVAQAQVGVGYYRSGYGSVQKAQDVGPLSRDGNMYYYHGKSMTEKEMVAFIQKDCERAYHYYKRYQSMENAGWSLLAVGPLVFAGGIIYSYTIKGVDWRPGTYAICSIGGVIALGSVPLITCGRIYKNRTNTVYNQWCSEQETAAYHELKLTSGNNGLGLALSF